MKRFYILFAVRPHRIAAGLTVVAQNQQTARSSRSPTKCCGSRDPNDWLTWRRTLDSWGYSPLNEVNRNNVSRLKMIWTRGIGTGRTQEATPLVYNGTMYIPNPGDLIMAMDAKTGDLKWEYKRKYPEGVNGGTNRNMAIWGTTIIDAGADNSVYAVDARTGKLVWETQVLKVGLPANASSGPIIANGKVITGRQCQPAADQRFLHHHGARCADWQGAVAHAHDPAARRAGQRNVGRRADGAALARRHVDGAELRPRDQPDLRRHVGHDSGAEVHARRQPTSSTSITTRRWPSTPTPARSCGTTSTSSITGISIIRSSACSSRPRSRRTRKRWPGSTRRSSRARRARSSPASQARPASSTRSIGGRVSSSGRRPTVMQNVVQTIDGATGKVTVNPETIFTAKDQTKLICPGSNGGKNWPAGAYNPTTNAMYMPLQNMCMNATTTDRPARSEAGLRPRACRA